MRCGECGGRPGKEDAASLVHAHGDVTCEVAVCGRWRPLHLRLMGTHRCVTAWVLQ